MKGLAFAAACLLASIASCTSSGILSGLAPFPCAQDGTCPAGFACSGGQCSSAGAAGVDAGLALDAVCSGEVGCSDGVCMYGVCVVPGAGGPCPSDHPVPVLGQCLLSCSGSTQCPSGLACIWLEGGDNADVLEQACVSAAQAAVLDTDCSEAGVCPGMGSAGLSPYSCIGSSCVLECWPGQIACPPGTFCSDPTPNYANSYGCLATQ